MFQLQQLYQIKIFNADHQVKMTETESMTGGSIFSDTLVYTTLISHNSNRSQYLNYNYKNKNRDKDSNSKDLYSSIMLLSCIQFTWKSKSEAKGETRCMQLMKFYFTALLLLGGYFGVQINDIHHDHEPWP